LEGLLWYRDGGSRVRSVAYLVQQEDLSLDKIRTVFTVSIPHYLHCHSLALLSGVIEGVYVLQASPAIRKS
jgi:hypothetical protein